MHVVLYDNHIGSFHSTSSLILIFLKILNRFKCHRYTPYFRHCNQGRIYYLVHVYTSLVLFLKIRTSLNDFMKCERTQYHCGQCLAIWN